MQFDELIKTRYSVRKFLNKPLEDKDIKALLEAGHLAPTGCNNQPYRVLVLNNEDSISKLKTCTKCHFDAPTAMLVCYHKGECWTRKYDGKNSGVADACIVSTHIMLKAHDIGVGVTWVMHFDPEMIRETYDIPSDIEPVALLVMGYPHEDAEPNPLHYKYRPVEEVVVYDKFI